LNLPNNVVHGSALVRGGKIPPPPDAGGRVRNVIPDDGRLSEASQGRFRNVVRDLELRFRGGVLAGRIEGGPDGGFLTIPIGWR